MPSAKLKAVPAKAPTLGQLADSYWDLRENKRAIEKQLSTVEHEMEDMELAIREALEAQGLDSAKGKKGNVSFGKPMVKFQFDLENNGFEAFTKYVKKTGYFHLFQRRLTDTACREIFEQKGGIPGLKTFVKRTLSLTSVNQ